jgi:methionine-rich copper-binding protein CopC
MAVIESYPKVDQIMDGEATPFVLRFDGPIDQAGARSTLVTPSGQRSLKARLGSRPSTLFAAVGKLAPGAYSLAWRAKARDGEISAGTIPFRVAPRQVPANPPAGRLT